MKKKRDPYEFDSDGSPERFDVRITEIIAFNENCIQCRK